MYYHYEGLTTYGGKIYGLVTNETHTGFNDYVWSPSEIVEFDVDLNELRRLPLNDGTNSAKNSGILEIRSGKLYIGSTGSALPNTAWGDVWEVDIASWKARQLLAVNDTVIAPYAGISGLAVANDGTAFLLVGGYDANWDFGSKLFVTTITKMSAGDFGTVISMPLEAGYSRGIAWSEFDQTFWVMVGKDLQARSKTGALLESFTPAQLGNNIYTISPLEGGGLFYAVSDYINGSAGIITKSGSTYTVRANLADGFGGDAVGFAFKDHKGNARALIREYHYGPDDSVFVYDPKDFKAPIVNVSNWGTNISAVTSLGNYLYIGAYESYNPGDPTQLSGGIKRVNMSVWPNSSTGGGGDDDGGGGCDSGLGVMALLLLFPVVLIKLRKN